MAALQEEAPIHGQVQHIETCGTLDGPGLRYIVFLQGCMLKCQYCHNPECRPFQGGMTSTPEEIMREVKKYRTFIDSSGGGVTISGGEPLAQPEFTMRLLDLCRAEGIHTVIDTSGFARPAIAQRVVDRTDLVLLDIKSFDEETYRVVTGVPVWPTLQLAQYMSKTGKPFWVRFVLVPGLTDAERNIAGLADFVAGLDHVERVEILPFHKMGEEKWRKMGFDYHLAQTPAATPEMVERAAAIFEAHGVVVTR